MGQGEVGRSTTPCMAAVAAGYRKGLVSAGWPVLLVSCTNRCRKRCFNLVRTLFLGSFQSGGAFSGRKVLTIERSVMSGCTCKGPLKEAVDQVSWANSLQKWKYR